MAIKAKISVDNTELKKGLKNAESSAKQSMKNIANAAQGATSGFKGLVGVISKLGPVGIAVGAVLLAVGTAVTGIIKGVNSLANKMDGISKNAKSVNLTTTAYQALEYAARKSGTTIEKVVNLLSTVDNNISKAKDGVSETAKAFAALGVSFSELDKLNPEDRLMAILEAMNRLKSVGKNPNDILYKLFSRKEVRELNKMAQTDFSRLIVNAKTIGITISEDQIKLAEAYNDSLTTAKSTLVKIASELELTKKAMKTISDLANELTAGLNNAGKVPKEYSKYFIGIGDAIEEYKEYMQKNHPEEYAKFLVQEKKNWETMIKNSAATGTIVPNNLNTLEKWMTQRYKEKLELFDPRFKSKDSSTWVQRRYGVIDDDAVFSKEKIQADLLESSLAGLIKQLDEKTKKHQAAVIALQKEVDLQKEIQRLESEYGVKMTDEQKTSLKNSIVDNQLAKNKELIAVIEDESTTLKEDYEIQLALLANDKERVEMLKQLQRLRKSGVTVSETDYQMNSNALQKNKTAQTEVRRQIDEIKNGTWVYPNGEEITFEKLYERVIKQQSQRKARITALGKQIDALDQKRIDLERDKMPGYQYQVAEVIRNRQALIKQKSDEEIEYAETDQSMQTKYKPLIDKQHALEAQLKELEAQGTQLSAIDTAIQQSELKQQQSRLLDTERIKENVKQLQSSFELQDSLIKGDYVGECWKKVPDWRFGQLMCNLQKKAGNDLFYMEDEDFMDFVDEVRKEFENI